MQYISQNFESKDVNFSIDMEAAEENLWNTEDQIETFRNPSHVKNLSRSEMLDLFASHNLSVEKCDKTEIRQKLKSWLALTDTPENIQDDITERSVPAYIV